MFFILLGGGWGVERDIYLVVNPLVKLVYILGLQIAGQAPSNVFAILGNDIIYMLLFIRFVRKDKPDYMFATAYFS